MIKGKKPLELWFLGVFLVIGYQVLALYIHSMLNSLSLRPKDFHTAIG